MIHEIGKLRTLKAEAAKAAKEALDLGTGDQHVSGRNVNKTLRIP